MRNTNKRESDRVGHTEREREGTIGSRATESHFISI